MAKESVIMRTMREDYQSLGLDIENTCKKTAALTRSFPFFRQRLTNSTTALSSNTGILANV